MVGMVVMIGLIPVPTRELSMNDKYKRGGKNTPTIATIPTMRRAKP